MARPPLVFECGAVFHIRRTFCAESVESSVGGTVENVFLTDVILRRDTIEKYRV